MGRLLVLGLLAVFTAREIPHWQSNRTLWTRAVQVNPRQARPALNLAATYREMAEADESIVWLTRAGERLDRSPRAEELRRAIRHHLLFWEAFGFQPCQRTAARRFC